MRRLQPVIWSKGTFLTPQHLQAQDRFIESVLQFRMEAQSFRPWGFSELTVDQEALASGTLAISSARGMFSDGLPFDIPESDPAPPPKALVDHFEPDQDQLDIYLGVPPMRDYGLNVSIKQGDADSRFTAYPVDFRDENTGQDERPVLTARKNFRLLAETEVQRGLTAIRVARVQRTASDVFQLDPHFVPPLLSIRASDYLVSIVRRLVEILSAKSSELADQRRHKNQALADFTTADVANFWLLYTINTAFPQMRHLFEVKGGHPEELFAAMLATTGALTTFSREIRPGDLPVYDHNELGPCFTDLDEKLRKLLETVVPRNFASLPLKLVRPSIYATAIDDERYLKNTRLYLAMTAEAKAVQIIKRAPQIVKVCSDDHVDQLVRQALPGLTLTHVATPPAAVPVKMNYQYFSLEESGAAWEAILRSKNLAAYVPSELPSPRLELIVLLPE